MFRKAWQKSMIAMARSKMMKDTMQNGRAGSFLADKYVAGNTSQKGFERAQELFSHKNIRSSLFYLGEYVDTKELVDQNVASKFEITGLLGGSELEIHISVDPTQIGLRINKELALFNLRSIAKSIQERSAGRNGFNCLLLDMEDLGANETTISFHNQLQDEGLPVALTLQAYLRKTEQDMLLQIERGSRVRLVRGAFAEGFLDAFSRPAEIRQNYIKLIKLMLSPVAKQTGFYPIFATHDRKLHELAIRIARQNGWKPGEYEFEMLLGVRSEVAEQLANSGEAVRLYVPFGQDWWPHAVRRIGENPRNAVLLLRSLVS